MPTHSSPTKSRLKLAMTRQVYRQIRREIGSRPAEQGGVLGGSRTDGVVRHFYFDCSAEHTRANYSPDHEFLNRLFAEKWNPAGISFLGFVHSHPDGLRRLSQGDVTYARRILDHLPALERLLLPLAMTEPDSGRFELIPFSAVRHGDDVRIERMELALLDGEDATSTRKPAPPETSDAAPEVSFATTGALGETFRRVGSAYDLGRLAASRVVCVGTGGAAGFIEELVRAGVGEFVLIDADQVSESNMATQQVYRRDLGRRKVDCLAERCWDINPCAALVPCPQRLEEIADADFARLAAAPLRQWTVPARQLWGLPGVRAAVQVSLLPCVTLLCGLTDSFEAQARVNRLALQLGLPSLCAQVYQEGRGAEITFTYPGLTPACHRCVLRSRYQAYLADGFQNHVTSDGTPIFATTRLNALKGFLALALLHHSTDHPRWGALLTRIGPRNLVQIRMDPDLALPVFDRVFGGGDRERILFDEVVWLPQQPDCPANGYPACPDCGGTGDLRSARGTFVDTRLMRK
jgi:proteasome lid subunit RPN8/RPN11